MSTERLSGIATSWTLLRAAYDAPPDDAQAARQLLIERYGGAARRYLTAVVRDPDVADDLSQEFALDLVRGGFRRADPARGRFRDYVKSALVHLVGKHRRRERRQPRTGTDRADRPAPAGEAAASFDRHWRAELLARAWAALADANREYHAALRLKAENPKMRSEQIAEQLGPQLGRTLSAATARQLVHRARERFAALLLGAVSNSLLDPTPEAVDEELAWLGLLKYYRASEPAGDGQGGANRQRRTRRSGPPAASVRPSAENASASGEPVDPGNS
jgi:RNA polymerase sigma factor (sigma-70 family)